MIIAIDGPAGSGKSTTARRLAERLGYLYLDTGAMYRTVGLAFLRANRPPTAKEAAALLPQIQLDVAHAADGMRVYLDGEDVSEAIRTPEATAMASRVGTLLAVRQRLVKEQRRIGQSQRARGAGLVVEGRDIGTVVYPDADVKVFMRAAAAERARRRCAEMQASGHDADYAVVLAEIEQRDRQDRERAHSPLRKADDALVVDTTNLGLEAQVELIFQAVKERSKNAAV